MMPAVIRFEDLHQYITDEEQLYQHAESHVHRRLGTGPPAKNNADDNHRGHKREYETLDRNYSRSTLLFLLSIVAHGLLVIGND